MIQNLQDILLQALYTDKQGNWDAAHMMVQDIDHKLAAWIHAYLHRKEPDRANASYWYHRAEKTMPSNSFQEEWDEIYQYIKNAPI
ncbi:hypothetical protein [Maribellus mangrovi]|uniref:hypothetical protein n=1 Tax=Maribellus mangrovi TaxID=3133146 RepID=UPI0030EF8A19